MRSQTNWLLIFAGCALAGVATGYIITLLYRPQLLPPAFRLGGLSEPTVVLLLGVDVVYSGDRGHPKANKRSFQGLSDTIMAARLDPQRNQFSVLSIPRDTTCAVPGNGRQKINSANAIGGEQLAMRTVEDLTGIHCDHYVVLNVHGLVELVDAVGGITLQIPKRMRYRDRTAGLNINLDAGPCTLNGAEAMGFVRFRHDALGDIGRVQRQQLFIQAVMDKALSPSSWAKLPELLTIAQNHVKTDLAPAQAMQMLTFVRAVPKENQHLIMLPGNFSGTGSWDVEAEALKKVVSTMLGETPQPLLRRDLTVTIENASTSPYLSGKLTHYLAELGYQATASSTKSEIFSCPQALTSIIAERGNPQDAALLKGDLHNQARIINASLGDIHSSLTLVAGDDLIPLVEAAPERDSRRQRRR